VPIANLKGEARANAFMKAETKAKRRVTLSICGLGILDETEIDSIDGPKGYVVDAPAAPVAAIPPATERGDRKNVPAPSTGDIGHLSDDGPSCVDDGQLRITRVDITDTRNKNVRKALLTLSNGQTFSTINPQLTGLASELAQEGSSVLVEGKDTKWGMELVALHRAEPSPAPREALTEPLDASEIPF
jgi:hypothetical protein